MLKKLLALVVAFAFVFAPGALVGIDDHADAKRGYKSGIKSFNQTPTKPPASTNSNSTINKQQAPTSNTMKSPATAANASKGGFMKGLLYGGLAGLLLGGLFGNMGALGAILGLLINALAIAFVVMLIVKAFTYFRDQKREKDKKAW